MRRVLLAAVVLALACTAAPPTSTTPAPAARNPEFKNVKVLPQEMSREQLLEVMKRFTQALGVRCEHCHVVTETTPEMKFDFPSDAKPNKQVARVMIQMTQQINGAWMERVEAAEGPSTETAEASKAPTEGPRVGCWTCHRGKTEPEMPPPLPQRGSPGTS